MTIERRNVGKRLSDLVIYAPPPGGRLVYLAGQVAEDPTAGIGGANALGAATGRPAARRSGHRQDAHPLGDDLPDRHERLRRNERGLGRVGAAGRDAGARHGGGAARQPGVSRRRSRSSPRPADLDRTLAHAPFLCRAGGRRRVVAAATRASRARRRDAAGHARDVRRVHGPVLRAGAVHPGARRRLARVGPGRPHVHRLRGRRRGHRARPLPSGDGQGASTSRRARSGTSRTGSPTSPRCGSRSASSTRRSPSACSSAIRARRRTKRR